MHTNTKLPALLFLWLLWLLPAQAAAFTADVGQVVVIEDTTGEIHTNMAMINRFCREAAKVFYQSHPDIYDTLIAFTTKELNFMLNVYQGTIAKADIQGIGLTPLDWTSLYGSQGRLRNCVKMGQIAKLPDNPDHSNLYTYNLTGVEILAHEYSHQWLMWLDYDKNDGQGVRDLLRGYESDSPNGHWNNNTNSHSVMYGNCLTDLGAGQFKIEGCDRHYNDFELYAMGLLPANEVQPLWFVDRGSAHGDPSLPLKKGQSGTVSGTKVTVAIDDVIRALGARVPSAAASPKNFRVAFLLVSEQGVDAPTDLINKVEAYRQRFVNWFSWATGGHGSVDTQLERFGDGGIISDGGPVLSDGGALDGGGIQSDGGPVLPDGGALDDGGIQSDGGPVLPDGGALDGGGLQSDGGVTETDGGSVLPDGGAPGPDAGREDGGMAGPDGGVTNPPAWGCACHSAAGGGSAGLVLLLIVLLSLRRRRFSSR